MKKSVIVMALAATACGKSAESTKATFFVPRAALSALGDDMRVVGTHDSGLMVEASPEAEKALRSQSPESFRLDQFQAEFSQYNFPQMEKKLQQFQTQYPELAKLETYGTSKQGRPEYFMTISGNKSDDAKPELMITAATHGNETITVDVVLGLMNKLLAGYGHDQRITDMVDNHTLYFVPAVCVDSYVAQTRENEGRDPNRDYPYPTLPSRNPVGCTRDIMAFADSHSLAGSMDYHSAASMIMFPWAYTYSHIPAADYQKLDALTTHMAQANGFEHGDIASTIYIAPGSSADYYYWKHNTMATAIEVSHNFAASAMHAGDIVTENTESTWRFIENFN